MTESETSQNTVSEGVQRVIIPKGVIKPNETTIIKIPSYLQNVDTVVAIPKQDDEELDVENGKKTVLSVYPTESDRSLGVYGNQSDTMVFLRKNEEQMDDQSKNPQQETSNSLQHRNDCPVLREIQRKRKEFEKNSLLYKILN